MIILVTGGGGLVDGFAAATLAKHHTVIGCYRQSPSNRLAEFGFHIVKAGRRIRRSRIGVSR